MINKRTIANLLMTIIFIAFESCNDQPAAISVAGAIVRLSASTIDTLHYSISLADSITKEITTIRSVRVISLHPYREQWANESPDSADCNRWHPDSTTVAHLLQAGMEIGYPAVHYHFTTWPCGMEGEAVINGVHLHYRLNAGSFFELSGSKISKWYRTGLGPDRKYFLSTGPDEPVQ